MIEDDSELTRLVRDGDDRAAEDLYRRHHGAVLSYAKRLCRDPQTAEDLASEAFARTLRTVRSGTRGPSGAWRPYLYTVVKNTATAWARSDRRIVLAPELTDVPAEAEEDSGEELALAVQAYESLPERWKTVLWHTIIEDEPTDQVASILGITANNVKVLAFRAREGLRRAYLASYASTVTSPECRAFTEQIAGAVRKPGARRSRAFEDHLDTCGACARARAELLDLNTTLRASLPLALLLPALAKELAATDSAAATAANYLNGTGNTIKGKLLGAGSLAAAGAIIAAIAVWPTQESEPSGPAPAAAQPSPSIQPKPPKTKSINVPKPAEPTVITANGGFELPALEANAWQQVLQGNVPGWSTTANDRKIEVWSTGFEGITAADGKQFVELNAAEPGILYQDVKTTPGQEIRWQLKHRGRDGLDTMRVLMGSPNAPEPQKPAGQNSQDITDSNTSWNSYSGTYVVPVGQTVTRFAFQPLRSAAIPSRGNLLDAVVITTSPADSSP